MAESDIPALAELARAAEQVDRENEHLSEQDFAEEYADPLFDPQRGSLTGFDGERMVAFAQVTVRSAADDVHRMSLYGVVHPEYRGRGLGTRLLDWAPEAARPLHEERFPQLPLVLSTGCISTNKTAAALLERFGYAPVRYYYGMRRSLHASLPPIEPLEGIEIALYSPALDDAARLVKNKSFEDHWASTPTSPEQWKVHFADSSSFRPDLSFLAFSTDAPEYAAGPGRLVGLALTKYFEADTAATGRRDAYIAIIGTLREARRRGVATALLATVLRAARDAGFDSASLGVDSQNPSGALGLYERAGLAVEDTWINYAREY